MARVKTERVAVPVSGAWFQRVVNFSTKTKTFSCAYPPDVADALGEREAQGQSVDAAEAAWVAGCKRATEASKAVERVIVVRANLDGLIRRGGRLVFGEEGTDQRRERLGVRIETGVFDEVRHKLGEREVYRYDEVKSSLPVAITPALQHVRYKLGTNRERVYAGRGRYEEKGEVDALGRIPWSPEAEAWVLGLVTALEDAVLKIDGLRRDQVALRGLIARGQGILLVAGNDAAPARRR